MAGHAIYADTGHILFARGAALMAVPFDAAELALTGEAVAVLEDVRHPNVAIGERLHAVRHRDARVCAWR